MDAGTTLAFKNASTKELHEMVVIRIPDDERRSVQVAGGPPHLVQGMYGQITVK